MLAFHFEQSDAAPNESGTWLTVKNDETGLYEHRRIREYPELPDGTIRDQENSTSNRSK